MGIWTHVSEYSDYNLHWIFVQRERVKKIKFSFIMSSGWRFGCWLVKLHTCGLQGWMDLFCAHRYCTGFHQFSLCEILVSMFGVQWSFAGGYESRWGCKSLIFDQSPCVSENCSFVRQKRTRKEMMMCVQNWMTLEFFIITN